MKKHWRWQYLTWWLLGQRLDAVFGLVKSLFQNHWERYWKKSYHSDRFLLECPGMLLSHADRGRSSARWLGSLWRVGCRSAPTSTKPTSRCSTRQQPIALLTLWRHFRRMWRRSWRHPSPPMRTISQPLRHTRKSIKKCLVVNWPKYSGLWIYRILPN